jgi:hypothetical protein
MSYNLNQYKQYRESRKRERELLGYNTPKEIWRTESVYVDRETGEVILKRQLENGEYIKLKQVKNYENNNGIKTRRITTECKRTPQRKLFWDGGINQEG